MRSLAYIVALGVQTVFADYSGNLNYRSPSTDHDALGLDLVKITKRHLAKRDAVDWDPASLNFTHSVASVSRDNDVMNAY